MSLKLINNLEFAEKLNSQEAVTESGKDFLKGYRGYVYANPVSCSLVNSFCNEAKKFGFDTGLMSILESVLGYIKENNISWKLSSACESIANQTTTNYNYIAKTAINKVEKLLEMNESSVISYIKAGALRDIQYVTEFRNICKEVYATNNVNEARTISYTATAPCSYVHIDENDNTYFMVNGKTFMMTEGNVSEATCNNTIFNRVNSLLANMSMVDESLTYQYQNSFNAVTNKYEVSESSIKFTRGNQEAKVFESANDFISYCDTLSITMPMNEKLGFMQTAKAIGEVYEAFDNICQLDQVKNIVTFNGDMASIIEGKDNVNITVFKSSRVNAGSENYNTIGEALKFFESITGINLMGLYETRILEESKKANPEDTEKIQEELKQVKESKIAERREKIAMLAEQFKNDPLKISILNKCAKDLAMLESK